MPFALIVAGILLFLVAINGTYTQFGKQLYSDMFTGSPSFIYWILAIVVIGFIGYIQPLRKVSIAFLVLVVVAAVVASKNGYQGLFSQFSSAIQQGPAQVQGATPLSPVAVTDQPIANASSTQPASSVLGSAVGNMLGSPSALTPAGSHDAALAGAGIGAQ